jgi:hypothetical protein
MAKFSPISFLFRFNWASIRPRDFLKLPLILAKFHPSQSTAQAPEQVSSNPWVFSESNRHVLAMLEGRDRMLGKRGLPVVTPKASSSSIALHDLAMLREAQNDLTCKIVCRTHRGDKSDFGPGSLRIIVSRSIVSRVGRLEHGEVSTLHIFVGIVDKKSMLFFSRILGALYIPSVVSDCWTPRRHPRWFRQVLFSFGATEPIAEWRKPK